MKRVLTAIILPIALFGEITEQVENSTEQIQQNNIHELPQKKQTQSTTFFNADYYKDPKYQHYIYQDLITLFKHDKQNVRLNIALGIKAIEAYQYDAALAAFERVLIYEPNSYIAKYEMARVYTFEKSYNQAILLLEELLKRNDLPDEMRTLAQNQIALINLEQTRMSLNLALILGIDWDDNVTYASSDTVSDFSHIEVALINFNYKFMNDLTLKNNLLGYAKTYISTEDVNLLMYSYNPILNYKIENFSINFGLYLDQVAYGSSYNILSYGVYPTVEIAINDDITLIPSIKNFLKYDKLGTSMGSKYSEYKIDSIFKLGNSKLKPTLVYSKEIATQDYDSLNKNQVKLSLTYSTKHNKIFNTSLFGGYKFIDYSSRDDNQLTATLNATLTIPKLFSIKTTLQHISNFSTSDSSTYHKNTLTCNLVKGF